MAIAEQELTTDYSAPNSDDLGYALLPVGQIAPSPDNPRRHFNADALQELADSIRLHGVLEPIVVRPARDAEERPLPAAYLIIAGERRWRAATLAECASIPAIIRECGDQQALELSLIENLTRTDLNPLEEAEGYARLAGMGYTQERIGQRVHRSQSAIANALRLLKLPFVVQMQIQEGALSASHGIALCSAQELGDLAVEELARQAATQEWSSKRLEQEVAERRRQHQERQQPRMLDTEPAPTNAEEEATATPAAETPAEALAQLEEMRADGLRALEEESQPDALTQPPAAPRPEQVPIVERPEPVPAAAATDKPSAAPPEAPAATTPSGVSVVDRRSSAAPAAVATEPDKPAAAPPPAETSTPAPPAAVSTPDAAVPAAAAGPMTVALIPRSEHERLQAEGFANVTAALATLWELRAAQSLLTPLAKQALSLLTMAYNNQHPQDPTVTASERLEAILVIRARQAGLMPEPELEEADYGEMQIEEAIIAAEEAKGTENA